MITIGIVCVDKYLFGEVTARWNDEKQVKRDCRYMHCKIHVMNDNEYWFDDPKGPTENKEKRISKPIMVDVIMYNGNKYL